MRTETLTRTLFTYGELSLAAQAKVRDWYREGFDYLWTRDNRNSLEAFCRVFPVAIRDWLYDACTADISPVFTGPPGLGDVQGRRLVAYLHNQYDKPGEPQPVFSCRRRYPGGNNGPRLSHVFREETCCPLTGYHMDEALLEPLRSFLLRPDNRSFQQLLSDCLWAWVQACRDDWSSQLEDEVVAETVLVNGWEFTQEGIWSEACFRWREATAPTPDPTPISSPQQ